jgi:hypothetical protein
MLMDTRHERRYPLQEMGRQMRNRAVNTNQANVKYDQSWGILHH